MELYLLPVWVLVAYYNLYKIPLMLFDDSYWIYPWAHLAISGSHGVWLTVHVIWALVHLGIIMFTGFDKNPVLKHSHYLFCNWVLINLHHFGDFPWYSAIAIQSVPLGMMLWGYRRSRWIYLLGFLSAPMLEIGLHWKSIYDFLSQL